MYLLRPTAPFSNPPLCTVHELETVYTIDHLADFHEALDFMKAAENKAQRIADRQREEANRRSPRGRR